MPMSGAVACPASWLDLLQLLLNHADSRLGDVKSVSEHQGARENGKTACLVRGGQMYGDHVNERGDAEGGLEGDEVDEAGGALLGVAGQGGGDAAGAGVGEEGEDGAEGGDGEDAVVELDEAGVLEHVAPPEVGAVLLAGVELVPELGLGRGEAEAHLGEFVVDEAGVEASDEAARHCGQEDEAGDAEDGAPEGVEGRVPDGLDGGGGGDGVGEQAAGAEDREAREEHPGVADEGGGQVGGQTILRDARVGAGGEEVVLETGLDHPPADEALEADQAGDAEQVERHPGRDPAAGDEVERGEDEGEADEAAPEAVRPLHEVDLLELVKGHVRVEQLELRRGTVFFELGLPVGGGHGRKRAGDGSPFRYAESTF